MWVVHVVQVLCPSVGDVCGMRSCWGVGCIKCVCLARGGVGEGGGVSGSEDWFWAFFTNPVGTGGVMDVCLRFRLRWVGACNWV